MVQAALPDALSPLRHPVFRLLWLTWAAANVCMWMNDMAAAWLMTSLTESASMIALVQTAATLPVFLLSLPGGALADLWDRRRVLMATQAWMAAVALILVLASWSQRLAPPLLLMLVFAHGVALAMRGPAFLATIPEVMARAQWTQAFALSGIASHGARVIGPLLGGAVIALCGVTAVFALNALVALLTGVALLRWRGLPAAGTPAPATQPREPFLAAMGTGLRYARHARPMQATLLRVLCFYLSAVGLLALLPVMVKREWLASAATYTAMFALLGAGAVAASLLLPRLQARWRGDALLAAATLAYAASAAVVAIAPSPRLAAPALLAAGAAWLAVGNRLMTSLQIGLPSWVRARGIAIYHTVLMGANALGALLWGRLADAVGVPASLAGSALATALVVPLIRASRHAARQPDDLGA